MESALTTGLVLIIYAGLIGGGVMLLDAAKAAHRRGMARVKAYDARGGNK
jgi:high-affinity Fe2+/Pb2+ permease